MRGATFNRQSQDSLNALAKVYAMCGRPFPCNRSKCKRCQKRAAEIEMDPAFENRVWEEISRKGNR